MRIRTPLAIAVDAVLVIVFAIMGRASHTKTLDLPGIAQTAWPFLVGGAVGWIVVATTLRRAPLLTQGVVIWADTLVIGMLLRVLTDQGAAIAFIIVATVTLATLLLGWRLVYWLVRGRHEPRYRRKPRA